MRAGGPSPACLSEKESIHQGLRSMELSPERTGRHTELTGGVADRFSRREAFRQAAAFGSLALLTPASLCKGAEPGGHELIVRNRSPLDLESPVSALDEWLTPNEQFFVRSHFGAPAVGLAPWELVIDGETDRPARLTLDQLEAYDQVTVPAVLQCSGNGRAFFRPTVPGVPWERGAVGHAEWTGVRLADVLKALGIRAGAAHVHLRGADGPPAPKTPAFFRSVPLDRALDPSTILALKMNGEPLPVLHGGPMRLVVPGWAANHWMKWLRTITVSREEAPGFFMQTGYRIPRTPAPPGAVLKPSDLVPVTAMNVKSLITWPARSEKIRAGQHEVRGVAWTGMGHVVKVEVTTDAASGWKPATLVDPPREGSWRRWRVRWDASKPGQQVLRVRATDSKGETQPEITPWNRSGYLWNGIDEVKCEVV
jgi:DMSO/TMAO reductase YedYZ molybdopterin-dependent catalytic subunit